MRDVLVAARFHLSRALRTRSALVLSAVFMLVSGGGAYGFTRMLLEMERQAARVLRVPETTRPGAMLETLRTMGDLQSMLENLMGSEELVGWALELPILSVCHFWLGLGLLPFLAAAVGAETVSGDIASRYVRYELLRTGRLELIAGRFLGQLVLLTVASGLSLTATWTVAMTCMVQQPAWEQFTSLVMLTPRLWAWSLPFLGIGVACSQLTSNTHFARILALGAATASWIGWGMAHSRWVEREHAWVGDLLKQLLPQGQIGGLWGPGSGWLLPAALLLVIGLAAMLSGYPLFARRNV